MLVRTPSNLLILCYQVDAHPACRGASERREIRHTRECSTKRRPRAAEADLVPYLSFPRSITQAVTETGRCWWDWYLRR